jgi:hypothetical protein
MLLALSRRIVTVEERFLLGEVQPRALAVRLGFDRRRRNETRVPS